MLLSVCISLVLDLNLIFKLLTNALYCLDRGGLLRSPSHRRREKQEN